MKLKTVLLGKTYIFKDIKEVLAKANEEKSGDKLAGLAAETAQERIAAKVVLSALQLKDLRENPDKIPNGDQELEQLDYALACCATREAVSRHAGSITETYTMMGLTYVQEGKNLTKVKQIVVTGGSLIHTKRTEEIAAFALYDPAQPGSLRPKDAGVWVDRKYILAAMGLLSAYYPKTALRIMKKELEYYGHSEQADS